LRLEIGRLSLQQTVYVIHDLKHSFILGLDFLTKQKASLNLQSGITFTFNKAPLTPLTIRNAFSSEYLFCKFA
jgi:hypothetical protein